MCQTAAVNCESKGGERSRGPINSNSTRMSAKDDYSSLPHRPGTEWHVGYIGIQTKMCMYV